MNIITTGIEGVLIIEPRIFQDSRGYFFESFNQREFEEKVGPVNFVQDNESKSCYGVVRGLHFQKGNNAQGKLVRVVKGKSWMWRLTSDPDQRLSGSMWRWKFQKPTTGSSIFRRASPMDSAYSATR